MEMNVESIEEVTSEIIEAWREELGRWSVSPATRELRFAAVKSFFRVTKSAGAIDVDPAASVPFPQRRPRVDPRTVVSREEIDLAVAMIEGSSPIALRDRAILKVLIVTGIRNSELRALTIDDADFEDRTLLVRRGKGRKMRIVPMGRAAAALEIVKCLPLPRIEKTRLNAQLVADPIPAPSRSCSAAGRRPSAR